MRGEIWTSHMTNNVPVVADGEWQRFRSHVRFSLNPWCGKGSHSGTVTEAWNLDLVVDVSSKTGGMVASYVRLWRHTN